MLGEFLHEPRVAYFSMEIAKLTYADIPVSSNDERGE
jgi:hypothetical protein